MRLSPLPESGHIERSVVTSPRYIANSLCIRVSRPTLMDERTPNCLVLLRGTRASFQPLLINHAFVRFHTVLPPQPRWQQLGGPRPRSSVSNSTIVKKNQSQAQLQSLPSRHVSVLKSLLSTSDKIQMLNTIRPQQTTCGISNPLGVRSSDISRASFRSGIGSFTTT